MSLFFTWTLAAQPVELKLYQLKKNDKHTEMGKGQWLEGEKYQITGAGRDGTDANFEGSFAAMKTSAKHFTFIARMAALPKETKDSQYGIMMLDRPHGTARGVKFRVDGRKDQIKWRWLMRHKYVPHPHSGSSRSYQFGYEHEYTEAKGKWLKFVRKYPWVEMYISDDGKEWKAFGANYKQILLKEEVYVGVNLTGGGNGYTPATMIYDQISFTKHSDENIKLDEDQWVKYYPKVDPWTLHLTTVEGRPGEVISGFVMIPEGLKEEDVRGIVYSAGSKEVTLQDGKQLPFDKDQSKRKPTAMDTWEGSMRLDNLRDHYAMLKHYRLIRVGGFFKPEYYKKVVEKLAKQTGWKSLPNIPFNATGDSFAGGFSSKAADLFPEICASTAPCLLGFVGGRTIHELPEAQGVPRMLIIGSHDGPHLKDIKRGMPKLMEKRLPWGGAPMWRVHHQHQKADTLIFPFFNDMIDARTPKDADFSKPVKLNPVKFEDGFVGSMQSWNTNFPQVKPASELGDELDYVWLPNARIARIWQAFVSFNPKLVIVYPVHEGNRGYGGASPHGWRDAYWPENKPFDIIASGPKADDLKVEWYAGMKRLEVLEGEGLHVKVKGLPAGLHEIFAIYTYEGKKEISNPITIFMTANKK